jgi:hypothetical protein
MIQFARLLIVDNTDMAVNEGFTVAMRRAVRPVAAI